MTPQIKHFRQWKEKNPIIKWLNDNDIKQKEFASMVGVSIVTVQNWLSGRTPDDKFTYAIAKVMGMPVSKFVALWAGWTKLKPVA